MQLVNQFPNVPPSLPPKSQIPSGYRLMVHKWSYPESRLGETVEIEGEHIKKMLTLDLNIPDPDFANMVNSAPLGQAVTVFRQKYKCVHGCLGCFNNAELHNSILTIPEITRKVEEGIQLGLESVKFLGPGELLMNSELFRVLDFLTERNIVIGIFTKAAFLGSDDLAMRYQKMSSEELVHRLTAYQNTTFLVGARSFYPTRENKYIPQNRREYAKRFDYHAARNLAIERLCSSGMNADLRRQRLAIIDSPVTADNDEYLYTSS